MNPDILLSAAVASAVSIIVTLIALAIIKSGNAPTAGIDTTRLQPSKMSVQHWLTTPARGYKRYWNNDLGEVVLMVRNDSFTCRAYIAPHRIDANWRRHMARELSGMRRMVRAYKNEKRRIDD